MLQQYKSNYCCPSKWIALQLRSNNEFYKKKKLTNRRLLTGTWS